MRLKIRSQDLNVRPDLREHVESRLQFALGRFGSRIGQVTIFLADLNGPRGGLDKRCRIVVRIPGSKEVFVEDRGQELTTLVDRATHRLRRSVRRQLDRRRERGGEWRSDVMRRSTRPEMGKEDE